MDHEELLAAALIGMEAQRVMLDRNIAEVKAQLQRKEPVPIVPVVPETNGKRRQMSAATRARMAIAQRKRWKEKRKGEK